MLVSLVRFQSSAPFFNVAAYGRSCSLHYAAASSAAPFRSLLIGNGTNGGAFSTSLLDCARDLEALEVLVGRRADNNPLGRGWPHPGDRQRLEVAGVALLHDRGHPEAQARIACVGHVD